jgi:dipeptidyl aminopeptidase/acylaminoacyl peptidase
MLERVSDPQASPDGKLGAYVVRSTDWTANKGVRHLWLAELSGKHPPRQATFGNGNDTDPRWTRDGAHILFLSTRSGSAQVWRLPLAGGEAVQVTDLPVDVNNFALSPDDRRLALSLDVFTDCPDLACTKKRFEERSASKASGLRYDRLFVRHWDTWGNGTRSQLFTLALDEDLKVAGAPVWVSRGIDGDVPSKPFGDATEYAFSPDGKTIAFDARIAGMTEAWSTNLDIFVVPADGSAKPKNLSAGNLATDVGPLYAPGGDILVWRAMKRPKFEADRYAIILHDVHSGKTRELAPDWDRSPDALRFVPDGNTLLALADELGQHRLFAIGMADSKVRTVTGAGYVSGFDVTRDSVLLTKNDLNSPDELYLGTPEGGTIQLSRHAAPALKGVKLGGFEQFSFRGAGGDTVYGYVMRPWNYAKGKKYPVAFIVHGGPQGSMGNHWHYRWNPAAFAGMGYAVVFIDFHGSTGYGQAFTDAISTDWGGKPLEDLKLGWAHALKTFDFLDGTRAAALGASYGGYMVNWIAGNWSEAFKCLVSHDGLFDLRSSYYSTEELWFEEWERGGTPWENPAAFERHNPALLVDKWKLPMLIIHGEKDFRVTPEQGLSAFTALQRRGIPSQLLVFPDENHWVLKPQNSVQWHETVQAWLKKWIGG